ncbi:hypothetical protein NDU88_002314 [Pleurodeles waltl]|uniref:Uncharacterized protein n=1 Tax=Pleurodeles waltl TaxID=8319 RepID=A0AAV7LIH1_PLEWA|nr:hypothetical protein NDU88_002314 [Pleurodeles waltl]
MGRLRRHFFNPAHRTFIGRMWWNQASRVQLGNPGKKRRRALGPGWIPSSGVRAGQRQAADAPKGRCGGMGFVPAGVAVPGEQRPGTSGMRQVMGASSSRHGVCGDLCPDFAPKGSHRQEAWEAESELEKRTALERPPLLSPGKELAQQSHMVCVAIEARVDVVRLLKGVYVLDAGVATKGGEGEHGSGVFDINTCVTLFLVVLCDLSTYEPCCENHMFQSWIFLLHIRVLMCDLSVGTTEQRTQNDKT